MSRSEQVLASVLAVVLTIASVSNQLQLALGARPLGDEKASPPSAYAPGVAPELYNESKREIPSSQASQCSSSIPGVFCPHDRRRGRRSERSINNNSKHVGNN